MTHSSLDYESKKKGFEKEIHALPEQQALKRLQSFLQQPEKNSMIHETTSYEHVMTQEQIKMTLDGAMATFCLHVESRIAALMGDGFYTIGPCGEEALSSLAHAIQGQDDMALHYRHLGVNIVRQLAAQVNTDDHRNDNLIKQILLDRARAYTVSKYDPITGGVHCSIGSSNEEGGGGGGDYIVTSTLASQCPSAVGRALGYGLVRNLQKDKPRKDRHRRRPISLATLGDGSIHNHHFWSAFHLARHARHQSIPCPMVFGISNNGLSISYSTNDYVNTVFPQGGEAHRDDPLVPVFHANGNDMMSVYSATMNATNHARIHQGPAVLVFQKIVRRFGHASSDRQSAYLSQEQIQDMASTDVLGSSMMQQAVEQFAVYPSYADLSDRLEQIMLWTRQAFQQATLEEKVTRQDMMQQASSSSSRMTHYCPRRVGQRQEETIPLQKTKVMRKLMTQVLEEVMLEDESVVYLGEDVEHGGYYAVTEGLAKKFRGRVMDFPPDETSLLGAAMGFSQLGLTPIVEIPYVKYLDCGADMFHEIAIMNWLSNNKTPNGMIVRLQGFDRGRFGGNFHTHNMLNHIPPGIDLVCYSNGEDYVRGFRHAILQAKKAGRVVVSVDCTHLLNLRHVYTTSTGQKNATKDRNWERSYPTKEDDWEGQMSFHDVRVYHGGSTTATASAVNLDTKERLGLVTYGNGVVTALQARKELVESGVLTNEDDMDIIDCPYLSSVPDGLKELVPGYKAIVFADICKDGPSSNVLSSMITTLQREKLLPEMWEFVAAPRTYNPLGSTVTFLNTEDIVNTCSPMLKLLK